MNPFVLIELIVFISAEASLVLDADSARDPRALTIAVIGVALFGALRFLLPWAGRNRVHTNTFFAVELVLLCAIAVDQMSPALIITSVSVCIRSVELVQPVRSASSYSAVTLAFVLLAMTYWARTGGESWYVVAGWVVSILLAWGLLGVLVTLAANERRVNHELRAAQRDAIAYARQAESLAADRERARIAIQLHDAVGHGLTALNAQLEIALRLRATDPDRAEGFVRSAKSIGSSVLRDVRETVTRLREEAVAVESAMATLERVCERYERDFALTVRREIAPIDAPAAVTTAFMQIAEEALTNVVRHARVAAARLALAEEEHAVALTIEDDGVGFDVMRAAGQGLAIMRERARGAGLVLDLISTPNGTRVRAQWPLVT